MNHLDYNYIQNYYPPGLLAVNAITPNPADQIKFLCSIWNATTSHWVDVHYQIRPKAMFILITGETADGITPVHMDQIYSKLDPNFRIRVILEFKKKTGEEIEKYTQHPKMTATQVCMEQEMDKINLKKLQNVKQKLIMIDDEEMFDIGEQMKTFDPSLIPSPPLKLVPNFHSLFPSPVPLKSNMSKITWNIKDYIPFDTFTILNNLSRDYAYN